MHVAAVQYKAEKGRFQASLSALLVLAGEAAEHADLVVLPEMAVTGYTFASHGEARAVAELPTGPTFQALSEIAIAHDAWIVAGFPELAGEHLYNSALVIDPRGELQFCYRKTLLFEADWPWATPGDSGYRAFDTGRGAFGVGICMDINDDGFVRWASEAQIDVIAFPTNWVEEGAPVWAYWRWRLAGLHAALVAANSYGIDGGYKLSGRSAVIAGGLVVANAGPVGDLVIRAEIKVS